MFETATDFKSLLSLKLTDSPVTGEKKCEAVRYSSKIPDRETTLIGEWDEMSGRDGLYTLSRKESLSRPSYTFHCQVSGLDLSINQADGVRMAQTQTPLYKKYSCRAFFFCPNAFTLSISSPEPLRRFSSVKSPMLSPSSPQHMSITRKPLSSYALIWCSVNMGAVWYLTSLVCCPVKQKSQK